MKAQGKFFEFKKKKNLFNQLEDVFNHGDIKSYDESFNQINNDSSKDLLSYAKNLVELMNM